MSTRQERAREIAQNAQNDYAAAQRAARNHTIWFILFGLGSIVLGLVAGYAGLVDKAPTTAGWLGVAAAVFAGIDTALGSKAKATRHRHRGAGLIGVAERARNLATSGRITDAQLTELANERSRLHEPEED